MSTNDKITVIMPCAGKGTRLGLPFPKEMLPLDHNLALIDLSFKNILPYKDRIDKVIIIIAPEKHVLLTHLCKWAKDFTIAIMYFNTSYFEWPGSILSASPLFGEYNFVLLPDSDMRVKQDSPLVPSMLRLLKRHGVAFGFVKETTEQRLAHVGAMNVVLHNDSDNSKDFVVKEFCDKPLASFNKYNSFWGTFGFTKSYGDSILKLFMKSVKKEDVSLQDVLGDKMAGAFELESYDDLGTWINLRQRRQF